MLSLTSSTEVARDLAGRIRARRLRRGWTQAELARRAGIKMPTYVVFERTGRIAFLRLLKVADVLELSGEFDRIGRGEDLSQATLAQITAPERRRGRRQRS